MRFLAALSLATLCAVASAQKSYLLKVDAPLNTKVKLKLETKMIGETQKGEMGFTATMEQTLRKKSKSELEWRTAFKVLSKYGRGAFAGGEQSFAELDGTVMDMVMAPTGMMKKVRMGDIEVPSAGTPSVVFPTTAVRVGSRWPGVVDMNGQKVKITYTLSNITTTKGKTIALIQGTANQGQIVRNVTPIRFWVDTKTGLMEKAEAKLSITVQGQTIRLEYKIDRYR